MFFKRLIEDRLQTGISSLSRLSGGDINEVYSLKTQGAHYILKCNTATHFPLMFDKEAKGLQLLGKGGVKVPEVIDQFEAEGHQFLLLEYLEESRANSGFWNAFGMELSRLHRNSSSQFGLEYDNYIGSLVQRNDVRDSWSDFFIEMRLEPLVKMGFDNALLDKGHLDKFARLYGVFPDLVPDEQPALIHGDLWSGNLLCSTLQRPVFIDPAVYFGHREMDLAMTFMFGGFDRNYLESYQEHFPLEGGWEKRIAIHNLYPNLVHLNLFGSTYLGNILSVLKAFI